MTLDDLFVHKEYAEHLLPRAVGYSAVLLDYFFRGKLDVDLFEADSTDPSVVQVSGTNASEETLDGGTLTLYADVPATAPAQGMVRKEAPAVQPNDPRLTVTAKKGEPVVSAAFRLPGEAERFVAVYKGKLGNEVPQGDFPGAVIGKALGGVRVESIYPDGEKRMLRTVEKVFPLPATADRLERVQWGALDNTFVGTVSQSSDSNMPDQIVAFKINRPLGSAEVPLVAAPDDTEVVAADVLKTVEFPYDLSLGVMMNWSTTYSHRQFLLTYDLNDKYVWNEEDPANPFYEHVSRDVGSPTSEVVVTEPVTFAGSFPLVLDRAHLVGGSAFTPYQWRIEEVVVDAQGRLLVLVRVDPTQPHDSPERRPRQFKKRNAQGQLVDDPSFGQMEILLVPEDFQLTAVWALLEVGQGGGTVLGVTAEPTVSEAIDEPKTIVTFQPHVISKFTRGPKHMQEEETWEPLHLQKFPFPPGEFTTVDRGSVNIGRTEFRVTTAGRYREDLSRLLPAPRPSLPDVQFGDTVPVAYYVDSEAKTSHSIRVLVRVPGGGSGVGILEVRLLRLTSGASPEALALFHWEEISALGEILEHENPLVRWHPETPAATALATPALPPPHFYDRMRKASSQAALFRVFDADTSERSALVIDLRAKTTQRLPADALEPEYVLLEPKYLYNTDDLRFHRLDSVLAPTVLPRLLAPAPAIAPPGAAYHVVPLP